METNSTHTNGHKDRNTPDHDNSHESSMSNDIEKRSGEYSHLNNNTIRSLSWNGIQVTVKDRATGQPKVLLENGSGLLHAGEMMAIMGPSGSGKTTLLNVLAHRSTSAFSVQGSLMVNNLEVSTSELSQLSCYVEQSDSLLGALTVKETLNFAAKLSLPSNISKTERLQRIERLIASFGLTRQANTLIGTPIRAGLSGGQKRRVSIASQLITSPKILFLDEPTSGLDSQASYEVMSFVKRIASKHGLLVISSIHQPSTRTFELFNRLLLMSSGRMVYNGALPGLQSYFAQLGYEMPRLINPAEYAIELVNTDFATDEGHAQSKLDSLVTGWEVSSQAKDLRHQISLARAETWVEDGDRRNHRGVMKQVMIPFTLVHRNFIKAYRDVIAYGIRIAMYMGLAILMGTVWLRLSPKQDNITAFTNAIFYGGAFMSFMAVAYIPSYLEDRSMYIKERANGLYGPTAFMIANFIIGIPFLFLITILFSVVVYWMSNFRPSASGFWTWVLFLFLDLLAAESLVILITNIMPLFVVSLAAVAFANGLWMSVNGFMVQPQTLNVFWRYVFHYIDYQAYVFKGMMVNEFSSRNYSCERLPTGDCHCIYVTDLQSQCKINGRGVLKSYGFNPDKSGLWIGILVGIIAVYRLLGWLVLFLKKH